MVTKNKLKIFTDGGARGNPGPAGAGVHVIDENGATLFQESFFLGKKTNNEAEYLAILHSLKWLNEVSPDVKEVIWQLDSKLVVEQLNHRWKIKEKRLLDFANQCWRILEALPFSYQIGYIPRELNHEADRLANLAMDAQA